MKYLAFQQKKKKTYNRGNEISCFSAKEKVYLFRLIN